MDTLLERDRSAVLRTEVLGVGIDRVELRDVQRLAAASAAGGQQTVIVAANPEKLVRLRHNAKLRQCVADAEIVLPDGIGCVLAGRWLHRHRITRVAGADAMPALCAIAERDGHGVFLFGGTEAVNQKASVRLTTQFPMLHIAGRQHGYVPAGDHRAVIDAINASGARYLFVALGTPRQEEWIHQHRHQLSTAVIQGVGGTFDVLAGTVRRAPLLFRRIHLEWLFRLLSNPRRWRRQLALLRFVWDVARERYDRTQSRTVP